MPIHGYPGNVITANPTAPTVNAASGVWTTEQQLIAMAAGNWPMALNPISQSLRFNSADSAYLNRTPVSSSNRRTWTWSGWVKRNIVNTTGQNLFATSNGAGTNTGQLFFNDDWLEFNSYASSAYQWRLITTQVWRDLSAWYHIVVAVDTTQATSSNRIKMYVNGVQITAFTTSTYPSQNIDGTYNLNEPHYIGSQSTTAGYLNGYLTEVNFIDGLALTPASFGQTNSNTGVWEPRQYTGPFGTNGFYLKFDPNADSTTFTADYLVVAGGGGGGRFNGGGGGAGGYRGFTSQSLAIGTAYTVTVGGGGAGSTSNSLRGSSGSNSVFSTITSAGGGGGGSHSGESNGGNGGSGGGGSDNAAPSLAGGSGNTPSVSPSQGNNGGSGSDVLDFYDGAGGGGGASATGANGTSGSGTGTGGNGGAGTASSISGSSVTYAGGGGGGVGNDGATAGTGGAGGGGNGGKGAVGTAGSSNTGGGGGGGGAAGASSGANSSGSAGGSGVVIIKIPSTRTAIFSSGVTSSLSTAVSGFKIYTVTATSTTSETVTFN